MKSLGYKHKSILDPILDEPESGKKPKQLEIQKSNKKIFELLFPLFIETIRKAVTDSNFGSVIKNSAFEKAFQEYGYQQPKKDRICLDFRIAISKDTFFSLCIDIFNLIYIKGCFQNELNAMTETNKKGIYLANFLQYLSKFTIESIETFVNKESNLGTMQKDAFLSNIYKYESIPAFIFEIKESELIPISKEHIFISTEKPFTYEDLTEIAISPIALDTYLEVCKKQCVFGLKPKSKVPKAKKKEILKKIKDIVLNILTNNNYVSTKIISKKRIAALTFTGYNVIIDKDLLIPLEGKYGNVEKNAFILTTILNEIINSIIRINSSSLNVESGNYFDCVLLSNNPSFELKDSEFLLNSLNWTKIKTIKAFNQTYLSLLSKSQLKVVTTKGKQSTSNHFLGYEFRCFRGLKAYAKHYYFS